MTSERKDTATVMDLVRQGNWPAAEAMAQDLLRHQPTNPLLHAYSGLCRFRAQDFQTAAACFERATALDPTFWQAGSKLAECCERLDDYQRGLDICRQFIRIQPNDPALRSLMPYFERMTTGPGEGWERSRHLGTRVIHASDEE